MKTTENEKTFHEGQRVMTPDGEGEVIRTLGARIAVRLNDGAVKNYKPDQLSDDADAG